MGDVKMLSSEFHSTSIFKLEKKSASQKKSFLPQNKTWTWKGFV